MLKISDKVILSISIENDIDIFKDSFSAKLFREYLLKHNIGIQFSEDFFLNNKKTNPIYHLEVDTLILKIEDVDTELSKLIKDFKETDLVEKYNLYIDKALKQMDKVNSFVKFKEESGTCMYEMNNYFDNKSSKYSFYIGDTMVGIFIQDFNEIKFVKLPFEFMNDNFNEMLRKSTLDKYNKNMLYNMDSKEVYELIRIHPHILKEVIEDLKDFKHINIDSIIKKGLAQKIFLTPHLNLLNSLENTSDEMKKILTKELSNIKLSELEDFSF